MCFATGPSIRGSRRNPWFIASFLSLLLCFFVISIAHAAAGEQEGVAGLRREWAHIKYQLPAVQREAAYARLYTRSERVRKAHPSDASTWIWEAVILANEAGEKHSLASIPMIKKAKHLLEKAISIRPDAEAGLAYAFLGDLYHSMLGWPLGFGSNTKAEYFLRKALNIAPNSLDGNYFMAIYLRDQGRLTKAIPYFRRAIQAPPRSGMHVADAGRKANAASLLRHVMNALQR